MRSANEKPRGVGLKSQATNRKLLDLSCLLMIKRSRVAVMSIVIELLVLLEKKMFIV